MHHHHLRPLERVILRLHQEGVATSHIGSKVGKKPGTVERILRMVEYKDGAESGPSTASDEQLRPIERVVLRLRSEGESYGQIGNRIGRSGAQVRRIESYGRLKLDS